MEVYTTDHSPDFLIRGDEGYDVLIEFYQWIRRLGIDSVRYDWRWKLFEPSPSEFNRWQLSDYLKPIEVAGSCGLGLPTIVLSSVPGWAEDLYRKEKDRERFFCRFERFITEVGLSLRSHKKVVRFQVLNELNTNAFHKMDMADIPRMCSYIRQILHPYNPEIKLMATIVAGDVISFLARPLVAKLAKPFIKTIGAIEFLDKYEKILRGSFDIIGVDYYPGMFHRPLSKKFDDLDLLKEVFEKLASWGIQYELAETGFPTARIWSSEEMQKLFYATFFKALKKLLIELRDKGVQLPSRIGIYQAQDEDPLNGATILGKIIRAIHFEHNMGWRKSDRALKLVARPDESGESTISRLIKELREIY